MKEPKFGHVKDEIKEKIIRRTWNPGDKIPSENMLAEQYHISRQTARKAIADFTE